jgi:hypothetical protein
VILFFGCLGRCGEEAVEGQNAGECSDGADNDGDGDFDCDDADCAGSPDCDEGTQDTDGGGDDTDGTGPTDAGIDDVTVNVNNSEWHYDVLLAGLADEVTLDIVQDLPSAWEEHHPLRNTERAQDGSWDRWQVTLAIVDDWSDQEDGVSTLFREEMWDTMVWRVVATGDAEDCVVWAGADADPGLLMEAGCREIEP